MLNRILDTLKKDNAVMFDPTDDRSIRFVGSMLSSHHFAPVPPHYAQLLKFTDGLCWNGVDFYGTRSHDREAKGYVLPGLIEANLEFVGYEFMAGKLILGRASEEIFVFDARQRKYLVVDRVDFSVGASFATFAEAVYLFVEDLF